MKPRTRTETRWVIVGDFGLYTGQCFTRADAICEHVSAKGLGPHEKEWPRFIPMSPYSKGEIMQGWQHWRKQGDRCVKATITWEESTQ